MAYQLVFDDETQQARRYGFVRWLKSLLAKGSGGCWIRSGCGRARLTPALDHGRFVTAPG